MGYLNAKAKQVRAQLAPAAADKTVGLLREQCRRMPDPPSFAAALTMGDSVTLIAEFKRRSPSAGHLATDDDIAEVAALYREAGARSLSVLTDEEDFGGTLDDLRTVAKRVPLPVLRKDFLVDEVGLYEARLCGAAAVLLIVRILEANEVTDLLHVASEIGLACLVEVHDEQELETAHDSGATIIGINNRDLDLLTTDLSVTERLAPHVGEGVMLVSESGIRSTDDVKRVRDAGADAVLVGETLLCEPGPSRFGLAEQFATVPR